jgi:hypothetical protein
VPWRTAVCGSPWLSGSWSAESARTRLGPEAGEWLQQATLAIRARVPLDVLRDTIQPFPTFSEIYVGALKALRGVIASAT